MALASAPRGARRASFAVPWRDLATCLVRQGLVLNLLLLVAVAFIAAFAGTGLLRAIYPFPIDGLERGALQEVARIRQGQPVYVAPSLDYVPFIYPPLYYDLSAAVAVITRSDLLGLRLVSLLASLGSIALVALLVRGGTGSTAMGLVSGGLLAACDSFVDGALDIGRVDATAVFLVLAAVFALRTTRLEGVTRLEGTSTWRSGLASGALTGLALLTKQSVVPIAVCLVALLLLTRRDQLAAFVVALGVTVGVGLLVIAPTWPWTAYYLWQLPRQHEVTADLATRFWADLAPHLALPAAIGPFYFVARLLAGDRWRSLFFYAAIVGGMFATAWITRSTYGGARNVELPAYAAVAILFGLGLHEALRQIGAASPRARVARAYLLAVAIGAFGVVVYNPRLWVPYRSDRWAAERLSATLALMPRPIFAGSYQGFVSLDDASGVVAPDLAAVNELLGEQVRPGTPEGEQWASALVQALIERRLTYVIIDPDNQAVGVPILAAAYGYVDVGPLFGEGDDFWRWRTGGWTPRAEVYARPDLVGVPWPLPTDVGGR